MIFRFLLLSDEIDHFRREITIDSEASFLELNNAILDSVSYEKDQITSFFICNDDWEKLTEITLIEMDMGSDTDNYIMENTRLSEALEDENQKLMFVFEPLTERTFFLELREIIVGKSTTKPMCVKSIGKAPLQLTSFEDMEISSTQQLGGIDENFYGDEEFDLDELDKEGFDGLEERGASSPYEESF